MNCPTHPTEELRHLTSDVTGDTAIVCSTCGDLTNDPVVVANGLITLADHCTDHGDTANAEKLLAEAEELLAAEDARLSADECGHVASGGNGTFRCNKPKGHKGLHDEAIKLRDGWSHTSWGDDGKASWATTDTKRLHESGRR